MSKGDIAGILIKSQCRRLTDTKKSTTIEQYRNKQINNECAKQKTTKIIDFRFLLYIHF